MNRRGFLQRVGAGSSFALVAGCLDSVSTLQLRSGTGDAEWTADTGSFVDGVVDGLVLGRDQHIADPDQDGVVALDSETGSTAWTYGPPDVLASTYTPLVLEDAIYFGHGDDAVRGGAGGTVALEYDGEKRWSNETGVNVSSRPVVADGVVYASNRDAVRAIETTDGEEEWRAEDLGERTSSAAVIGVTDAVVVQADRLVGLDLASGDVLWRYGEGDSLGDAVVSDGVTYVSEPDGITAVVDGDEHWHVGFDGPASVEAVHSGRVYVTHEAGLYALDSRDGSERWVFETADSVDGQLSVSTHDDQVYVWVDGPDTPIWAIGNDGDVTWEGRLEDDVTSAVADDLLYVGTRETIHALDPF